MAAGGTDSANNRRMLGMYLNKWQNTDADPVCHMGIQLAANSGSFDLMFQLYGVYNAAAIDLRQATAASGSAHSIWLGNNNNITFDTAATAKLGWDVANGQTYLTSNLQIDGGFRFGGSGGPVLLTGSAAPTANLPVGSIYSRVGGAVGATLYVSRGGGAWAAVAGV